MRRIVPYLLAILWFGQAAAPGSTFTLDEAIQIGPQKNTQIRLAEARLREVAGNIIARRAELYPQVRVGGLLIPPTFIGGAGVPIYSMRMAPSYEAFRLAMHAARANIRLAILDFVYKTRLAYVDAQIADKQVAAELEVYHALSDLTSRISALTDSGLKGKFELHATTVDRDTAKLRHEEAQINAERKRVDLMAIVGLTPGHPSFQAPLQSNFPIFAIPAGTITELQQMALARRVDLHLLRTLEATEHQRVLVAFGAYFPEFGLLSYNKLELRGPDFLNDLVDASDPTRNPGRIEDNPFGESVSRNYLQLTWRVFDGFATHGNMVNRAGAEQRRRAVADALEKLIPFQVSSTVVIRDHALNLLAQLDEAPDEDIIENARERLSAGFMSRLNYFDIVVQEARFRFSIDQARYQVARTGAELQRALGIDVEFDQAAIDKH